VIILVLGVATVGLSIWALVASVVYTNNISQDAWNLVTTAQNEV
jgi:hypothetical protein